MNLRSGTSILLMVLFVTIAACSGDDTPSANTLIIGDRNSVDFFQAFTPPRTLTLEDEQQSAGFNSKDYRDSLDLDLDGTFDIVLNYRVERRINGDSTMVTGMVRQTDKLILLGDSIEWNGDFFWDTALFDETEIVGLDQGYWQVTSDDGYTFDYYQYSSSSGESYKRTTFPDSHTGYMVFQYDTGNVIILGWLQLSITGALRTPQTDSYGYKIISKMN